MSSVERSIMDPVVLPAGVRADQLSRSPMACARLTTPRSNGGHEEVTPIVHVVDDDASVCDSLKRIIRDAGWQSSSCASAEEFLSRPRVLRPCCLIVDVTLPGMSGLDLQKSVAERLEMPVIFITGEGDLCAVISGLSGAASRP